MNLSLYLLLGLLIALLVAIKPMRLLQGGLVLYWGVFVLWSLQLIDPFSYKAIPWSYFFHINFSYHVDGLARLFSLLISTIGAVVFMYAIIYSQHNPEKLPKLLSLLQLFAISMMGVVLTDNTIILFSFWELTTVSSYLLIQFNSRDTKANQAAFQAMFISVTGGLALLCGFILLMLKTNSTSIRFIQTTLTSSHHLQAVFWLLLLAAITKSAQFPFYFWLPEAMRAPTPVSAYLHSATMVNAGIYLLARFHPMLSSLAIWYPSLAFFGMTTMVLSSVLSLFQTDLKAILAYTTLFALGTMVYLLASNEWANGYALCLFLLFHGLYKACAFMLVGVTDQIYGSRDIVKLKGIGRQWLLGSIIAIISFSAMAGLPPLFGFVIKQMMYEAKLATQPGHYTMMIIGMLTSMLIAATSLKCLYYWFFGQPNVLKQKTLRLGVVCPILLAIVILLLDLIHPLLILHLNDATQSILPNKLPTQLTYTHLGKQLAIITIIGGLFLCYLSQKLQYLKAIIPSWLNPTLIFEKKLQLLLSSGKWLTKLTQGQTLSHQLAMMLTTLIVLLAMAIPLGWYHITTLPWMSNSTPIVMLSILLILSGISLLLSRNFLINMISFTVMGLLISAIFILQGAPDVGMTQLLIEILAVIILVIALRRVPVKDNRITYQQYIIHALIAIVIATIISLLLFHIVQQPFNDKIGRYFMENSWIRAYGRNVVNVILVDFRACDTLGETLVILATAFATYLLIKGGQKKMDKQPTVLKSVLLQTSTQFLMKIMLILSILLVLRGHNYPGGGFIGALVATAAIALYILAFGLSPKYFDNLMPWIMALGVVLMLVAITVATAKGQPIFTGIWFNFNLLSKPIKLGSPLFFDFGVYCLTISSLAWLIAKLEDMPE